MRTLKCIAFICASLLQTAAIGQTKGDTVQQFTDPVLYDAAKSSGALDGKAPARLYNNSTSPVQYKLAPNTPVQPASNSCTCWQIRDSTWSIAPFTIGLPPEYRNDDGSTGIIPIPFSFCLYGQSWTDLYINNNGNVSFGAPYATFTASGFPNTQFVMVAPFWGDVDTRNLASGLVWFKITPTYMVIQWDSVGYYSSYADKLNDFQLIITDGNDPIVPNGNVSFCYGDMQWTTGDASGGVGGFGGSDAIVGANKGDGISYIQFGSFNQPGGVYNGPGGINSGIDWLDNQTIIFDACTNTNNIAPTVSGLAACDTLVVCQGDTLFLTPQFFSPEPNQTTTIIFDTTGVSGFTVVSNTPGNTASLNAYFIATNVGYNTIMIIAGDNGVPPDTTFVPLVISVLPVPVATAGPDTIICAGTAANLNASGGTTYVWTPSSGLNNPLIQNPVATPATSTTYIVTVSNATCTDKDTITVNVQTAVAAAGNDVTICAGNSTTLNGSGGVSYSWNPPATLDSANVASPIASPTVSTTYTLTVTDALGCTDMDPVTVNVLTTPASAFTYLPLVVYTDSSYFFMDNTTNGAISWAWYFGDGGVSTQQNPSHAYSVPGIYTVCLITTSANGCTDSVCANVEVLARDITIPNVFSPNGDNVNDVLVINNLQYFPNAHLEIFDRWGVKVFVSDNYQNDWNGKKMNTGGDCADGTYYFILTSPALKENYKGFIMLIRGK